MSVYELDEIIRRLSEGQKYSRSLFRLMDKLKFTVKKVRIEADAAVVLEYVEKLVYEDA
ncbi:hypothetical protein KAR91_52345 [Candidatus Pacearchaeota archaeon]|nr:hypothetical protein [Candidatus Pacearchaeota archaeon]